MLLSAAVWLSMNFCRVCAFAFGNALSAVSSAARFAAVAPPFMRTKEYRFFGSGLSLSQACCETVTEPNGEPPVGGLKMPLMTNVCLAPVEYVTVTGDPTCRWCFFA